MIAHLFITWFTKYFEPTAETTSQEKKKKKFSSTYYWSLPKNMTEMDKEINIFMTASTRSILQPMNQEAILNFKFYDLI